MEQQYQYSSLFTAGLLMVPRPTVDLAPQDITVQSIAARRRTVKLPEPIIVNTPDNTTSPSRKLMHRRRSSVTLQLSPMGALRSPTKAVENAWERSKQAGCQVTASGLRLPAETVAEDSRPMAVSSTDKLSQPSHVNPLPILPRSRSKRLVRPKPKPAPTSSLPDPPSFQVSPARGRPSFSPIQAETLVEDDSSASIDQ